MRKGVFLGVACGLAVVAGALLLLGPSNTDTIGLATQAPPAAAAAPKLTHGSLRNQDQRSDAPQAKPQRHFAPVDSNASRDLARLEGQLRPGHERDQLVELGIFQWPIAQSAQMLRRIGKKELFFQLDVGEAIASCGSAQIDVEVLGAEQSPSGQLLSRASQAYFSTACSEIWAQFGPAPGLSRWYSRELRVSTSESKLQAFSGDILARDGSEPRLQDVWTLLDARRPLYVRFQGAQLALGAEEGAVLAGVDWGEFRHAMPDDRLMSFALLLAAKLGCSQPGACAPESPQLLTLCGSNFAQVYCTIGADLEQIARESLTAREFRWWVSFERRQERPGPLEAVKALDTFGS